MRSGSDSLYPHHRKYLTVWSGIFYNVSRGRWSVGSDQRRRWASIQNLFWILRTDARWKTFALAKVYSLYPHQIKSELQRSLVFRLKIIRLTYCMKIPSFGRRTWVVLSIRTNQNDSWYFLLIARLLDSAKLLDFDEFVNLPFLLKLCKLSV